MTKEEKIAYYKKIPEPRLIAIFGWDYDVCWEPPCSTVDDGEMEFDTIPYNIGGMFCELFTSEGYACWGEDTAEWPVLQLVNVNAEDVRQIREKALNGELKIGEMHGSDYWKLFRRCYREQKDRKNRSLLNRFFRCLQVNPSEKNKLYVLSTPENRATPVQFFNNLDDLKKAYFKTVIYRIKPWSEIPDEQFPRIGYIYDDPEDDEAAEFPFLSLDGDSSDYMSDYYDGLE